MDFRKELKKRNLTIKECSRMSGISYSRLYNIVNGKVDINSCHSDTIEKLATVLGYDKDTILYKKTSFQTFRNNLHHDIKRNELQVILDVITKNEVEYFLLHEDYVKALYLVATVDFLSKKNDVPLCSKYDSLRKTKLEEPYFVGDSYWRKTNENETIHEFAKYNIMEGNIYDAV